MIKWSMWVSCKAWKKIQVLIRAKPMLARYYNLLEASINRAMRWHVVRKANSRRSIVRFNEVNDILMFWRNRKEEMIKKCGLTDGQLILVYCSIIRSVLEYASPVWAGLTQYLSDQIESVQKRALKIIFPFMSYEDALKKSGLINLCQRREDACVTFLKRSYYSSDLLRNLVPRCQFSRPYALRAGRTVSVPTSSRSISFGNFCSIKYQNHV